MNTKTKVTIGTIAALLVVGTFAAGCTTEDDTTATPAPAIATATAPEPAEPETTEPEPEVVEPEEAEPAVDESDGAVSDEELAETVFLITMHDSPHIGDDVEDELLLETAHNTCNALDQGNSFLDLATASIEGDIDPQITGTIIGGAVIAFCPEYEAEMTSFFESIS